MRMTDIPPAFVFLLGALIVPVLAGRTCWLALLIPAAAGVMAWFSISENADTTINVMGMALSPVHVHGATAAFAAVTCAAVAGVMLFGISSACRAERAAACVYAGGALGCMFAGDLLTLFVFWEVMTLGSTVIIWCGGQHESGRAGMRYFIMHALGGMLMLAGIAILAHHRTITGDADPLAFEQFGALSGLTWANVGTWMILAAMLVSAGAPPVSAWLPDAYPEASPSGTALLSTLTTKTAVFALITAFAGTEALVYIGLYMAMYGVIYGILENDVRRMLCYLLVAQVGLALMGVGIGTEQALNGATALALAGVIYTALLLMGTGAVLHQTGKRKFTELGGLYRTMPLTMLCCIVGGLSIAGFPLTSGFASKGLILTAIESESARMAVQGIPYTHLVWAWYLFQIATVGIFLCAGSKLLWFVFGQGDSGLRPAEAPGPMRAAMVLLAGACLFFGVAPGPLYDLLPFAVTARENAGAVYTFDHIMMSVSMLGFAGLAFFVLLPLLKRSKTLTLDTDWFYRRFAPGFWHEVVMPVVVGLATVETALLQKLPARLFGRPRSSLDRLGLDWAVSVPLFIVTALLVAYLLAYFLIIPA